MLAATMPTGAVVPSAAESSVLTGSGALDFKTGEEQARGQIIGRSRSMNRLLEAVKQVASSEATVLLLGESGTGKELIAEAVHRLSRRANHPLIKVNCAAIPENLLEDELFGHEKGAFTGAHSQRKGRFERANGGTVFLDEIGDMPTSLQAKLLRVLQEREFERLGGTTTLRVDVRIIAATNRDLEEMVREGSFREDLYYRINVIPLHLPPLRERPEDIPELANHFLRSMSEKNGRRITTISRAAMKRLMAYPWPGNVRELQNSIERSVVLASGPAIQVDDLPLSALRPSRPAGDLYDQFFSVGLSLDEFEKNLIEEGLRRSGGTQAAAARLLGLTRRTLQYRVEKYAIAMSGKDVQESSPSDLKSDDWSESGRLAAASA